MDQLKKIKKKLFLSIETVDIKRIRIKFDKLKN
jgi:hypothetical protein